MNRLIGRERMLMLRVLHESRESRFVSLFNNLEKFLTSLSGSKI